MKTLLVVFHTKGVKAATMAEAVARGARNALKEAEAESEVRVVVKRCADAGPDDVLGADGLILVRASERADCRMEIINADGSRAEMCGNGIRGFAKFVTLPAKNCLVLPDAVDTELGALTEPLGVAAEAVMTKQPIHLGKRTTT